MGSAELERGQLRWVPGVRSGLYHDRPRDLTVNVALCWRIPKGLARNPRRKAPGEPWYLATSLLSASTAITWYWHFVNVLTVVVIGTLTSANVV